jgi:hypothetical protein
MTCWPHCLGSVVRQHIMAGAHGRGKPLISWLESKRKEESTTVLFQGPPLVTQRPPLSPHLLKAPPPPTSIKLDTQTLTHEPLEAL